MIQYGNVRIYSNGSAINPVEIGISVDDWENEDFKKKEELNAETRFPIWRRRKLSSKKPF